MSPYFLYSLYRVSLTTSSLAFGCRELTHSTLYGLGGRPLEPRLLILYHSLSVKLSGIKFSIQNITSHSEQRTQNWTQIKLVTFFWQKWNRDTKMLLTQSWEKLVTNITLPVLQRLTTLQPISDAPWLEFVCHSIKREQWNYF